MRLAPGKSAEPVLATGQTIIHWLTPAPRGALAIFDSMDDFTKIHILPHPDNASILTWDDGEQDVFGPLSE